MAIDTKSDQYLYYAPAWMKIRDAASGEEAVKSRQYGTCYLPLPHNCKTHTDALYQSALSRAYWFNATGRTVEAYQGSIFRKPPQQNDFPANVDLLDVDGAGSDLLTFVSAATLDVIKTSRGAFFVDHDETPEGQTLTVEAANSLGLRAKLVFYPAESIIETKPNWIKLQEQYVDDVESTEFDEVTKKQIKVLDITDNQYRQRIYRKRIVDKKEEWFLYSEIYPKMPGNEPMDFIPFYLIGAKDNNLKIDDPILLGLVNANFQHYGLYSDFREGLHWIRPLPYTTGYRPGEGETETVVNSNEWKWYPGVETKVGILEFQGSGLKFDVDALNKLESHMVALGSKALEKQKSAAETAEKARIDQAQETSILGTMANNITDAISKALRIVFKWNGHGETEASYVLNTDYETTLPEADLIKELNNTQQLGNMSRKTLFFNYRNYELYPVGWTEENEQDQIISEAAGLDGIEGLNNIIDQAVEKKLDQLSGEG